ncbi:DNA-3-methyladenine glycosylase I [Sagittula salina]|uniref:DNA-3-methyladenine glycosylase I n=1 Tax=Sagittula salina TaxID=2820268 RepID=A0A940MLC5_9RHOB|nr:DNA-3-methyladenine glycosylase I [Sagittula salina]MBP0481708.1 DNA-3-methyladenine glycosylase I [Sagittula salina]
MRSYEEILDIAADRKGGRAAVLADVPPVKPPEEIAAIPDDRWLALMARVLFPAGMSWAVVDKKWPGIEAAFHGFDVARVAHMSDDWFDALLKDPRIIRSPPKVRAVQQNAAFIMEVSAEYGSFGRRVADWPVEDFAGLALWLKDGGARLGGTAGPYVLRQMGVEGFIPSPSVVARLAAEDVVDKAPTSRKAWAAVQAAFNTWKAESGESLTTISRVLAQSVEG